jgi:hypothetical protein
LLDFYISLFSWVSSHYDFFSYRDVNVHLHMSFTSQTYPAISATYLLQSQQFVYLTWNNICYFCVKVMMQSVNVMTTAFFIWHWSSENLHCILQCGAIILCLHVFLPPKYSLACKLWSKIFKHFCLMWLGII